MVALTRPGAPRTQDLVIPNPKLKLMDQVREVLRLKHDAIRTEIALPSEHRTSNIEH